MKEALKNNKKFIIIGVFIIILLIIGIAFAYLRTTLYGEKEYVIRAGSLGLILEEDNELTLEKQIPIEDSEGMTLTGFDFRLINQAEIDTDYTIYLDDIPLEEGETRMPDSAIRYSLTRNSVVGSANDLANMGTDPNRIVDTGTIGVDETINYTLKIWIDYDATTEEASGKTFKGQLRVVAKQSTGKKAATVLLENVPEENQYNDGIDTFITGEDPNNYIWYSGKLWRAVSVNNADNTVKLITQENITEMAYNSSYNSTFDGSLVDIWLNDGTGNGFLGTLTEPERYIKTDSIWDNTINSGDIGSLSKPAGDVTVTRTVGLLNTYEFQVSYTGSTYGDGYLQNGTDWWTMTPNSSTYVWYIHPAYPTYNSASLSFGVRPVINLKANIKISDGTGTSEDPYILLR